MSIVSTNMNQKYCELLPSHTVVVSSALSSVFFSKPIMITEIWVFLKELLNYRDQWQIANIVRIIYIICFSGLIDGFNELIYLHSLFLRSHRWF